ncbi:HNH endonuclease [Mycobacterium malmoense]|uniref:HNH endonuclease n=1 Tax=Mycobacterium malmoense TaxID=1780 RepID=UPI00114D4E44|nr:HNH endonuclease [Mycobacterium malmoense]
MSTEEAWRPIAGRESYAAISDRGRYQSLPRRARTCSRHGTVSTRLVSGCIRAPIGGEGERLRIRIFQDGTYEDLDLADVVLETFNRRAPSAQHYAAHRDGNRSNNDIRNLFWAPREKVAAA